MLRTQFSIEDVLCHFEGLEDPRSEINRKHPLVSVVVIAIMGVLAQASGPILFNRRLSAERHYGSEQAKRCFVGTDWD